MEAEAQAEAASETLKTMPPLTAERVTDITLGLGKAAVDALDKAARQLDDSVRQIRQDAPGFFTEMEEKGRPVREKLTESLKGFSITDAFNKAKHSGDTSPSASDPNAFDDIEALENRVRELEQQVSTDDPVPEAAVPLEKPSPFSMLELDDEPPVQAEAEEPAVAAPKKPAVRRTKKKPEGETPAA